MDSGRFRGRGANYSISGVRTSPTMDENSAMAAEVFDHFCSATTQRAILGLHRHMCDLLKLRPTNFPQFYPKLKSKLRSWKAQVLWKRIDVRASHKCYMRGRACPNTRVLVIGSGPCGLRSAIEAQLLGAKVVLVEKRDRLSRNNVLHLWPFVIHDLRALGAKKFFGKFCAGSIDHISIRQLQCILLKVALLLGVEFHEGVGFESLIYPNINVDTGDKHGFRACVSPEDHPVSQYEFDVLIGADGKRNTLDGFKRKEFRGRLAIAITANFINKHSEAEARVEEISGVAFIFNQKFFKDLYKETGIDLENIVYYKDETHYFVMTAKKHSLLDKGVIIQDLPDTAKLLSPENVNREALMEYAREAAEFSTNYLMPDLEFAVNHYGQPDVAMFDFTSMYAAENASRVIERNGYRLLMSLVGDSLLEPFWPTGSGCARGFLSSLDACWAIRNWGAGVHPLEVIAERESIYRLLAQTTPENLNRDYASYTLNPQTRYPNLNRFLLTTAQVRYLLDTDSPTSPQPNAPVAEFPKKKRRRDTQIHSDTLLEWIKKQIATYSITIDDNDFIGSFKNGLVLCAIIHRYRPELIDYDALNGDDHVANNQLAFDILEKECAIPPLMTALELTQNAAADKLTMLSYLSQIYEAFHGEIPQTNKHMKIDMKELRKQDTHRVKTKLPEAKMSENTALKATYFENKANVKTISLMPSASQIKSTRASLAAVTSERRRKRRSADAKDREQRMQGRVDGEVDENFPNRIKEMEQKMSSKKSVMEKKPPDLLRAIGKIESSDWNVREIEKKILESKLGNKNKANAEKERVPKWSREQFVARQTKMQQKAVLDRQDSNEKFAELDKSLKKLDQKLKEGTVLEQGQRGSNKVASIADRFKPEQPAPAIQKSGSRTAVVLPAKGGSEMCHFCGTRVYVMERLSAEGKFFHRACFRCQYCSINLRLGSYFFDAQHGQKFYCNQHAKMQGKTRNFDKVDKTPVKLAKDATDNTQTTIMKGATPERIELTNISNQNLYESDHLSQIDEDEWTDRNFGQSAAEAESSELSDSDSDDLYEDAVVGDVQPGGDDDPAKIRVGKKTKRKKKVERDNEDSLASDNFSDSSSNEFSYYDYSSEEDDAYEPATDDEENIRAARELRQREVQVKGPPYSHDASETTGSDTEMASDDETSSISSSSTSSKTDSGTEISTDSEFKLDNTTPLVETAPAFDNSKVRVTRGFYQSKREVEMKKKTKNDTVPSKHDRIETDQFEITPLVPDINMASLAPKTIMQNYNLNRTHSTEGIASKVSLELKKQYLLGNVAALNIQKSGSASTLDSKLKSFHTNITEHQKLLNPSNLPAPRMLEQRLSNVIDKPIIESKNEVEPVKEVERPKHLRFLSVIANKSDSDKSDSSKKLQTNSQKESEHSRTNSHDTTTTATETTIKGANLTFDDQPSNVVEKIPDLPKERKSDDDDIDTDSLSSFDVMKSVEKMPYKELSHSSSTAGDTCANNGKKSPSRTNSVIFQTTHLDDIPMDSLVLDQPTEQATDTRTNTMGSDKTKPKILNQPKTIDGLKLDRVVIKSTSDLSVSSLGSNKDQTATAFTETELSDWARDDANASDFDEDVGFEMPLDRPRRRATKHSDSSRSGHTTPMNDKFDVAHVCGKRSLRNSIDNFNNIEFMDTVSDESSIASATNIALLKNQGYVKFVNVPIDDKYVDLDRKATDANVKTNDESYTNNNRQECLAKDNANDKTDVSIRNRSSPSRDPSRDPSHDSSRDSTRDDYIQHVTRLTNKLVEFGNVRDSIDIRKSRQSLNQTPVKLSNDTNEAKMSPDKPLAQSVSIENISLDFNANNHDSNSSDVDLELAKSPSGKLIKLPDSLENLREKVSESGKKLFRSKSSVGVISGAMTAREPDKIIDSILDSSKLSPTEKLQGISQEYRKKRKSSSASVLNNIKNLDDILHSPNLTPTEKLKTIELERNKQKDLIHDMVMDRVKSTKKRRAIVTRNDNAVVEHTPDLPSLRPKTLDFNSAFRNPTNHDRRVSDANSSHSHQSASSAALIYGHSPSYAGSFRSFTNSGYDERGSDENAVERADLIPSAEHKEYFFRKKPYPLDSDYDHMSQTSEYYRATKSPLKEPNARHVTTNFAGVRHSVAFEGYLPGDTELKRSVSINDNLMDDNVKVAKPLKMRKKPTRTKSFSEISRDARAGLQKSLSGNFISDMLHRRNRASTRKNNAPFKSEPCLADDGEKKDAGKSPRWSIIQAVSDFFHKRSESDGRGSNSTSNQTSPRSNSSGNYSPVRKESKFSLFRISPKSKCPKDKKDVKDSPSRAGKSRTRVEETPPPIPPPPINYILDAAKNASAECDLTVEGISQRTASVEALDGLSVSEVGLDRGQRKEVRRSKQKRLRIAQEIQRQLEENEVKTRELEMRGVEVEKILRGEKEGATAGSQEEAVLLQEWLSLMSELASLRRYERELLASADALRLEEQHCQMSSNQSHSLSQQSQRSSVSTNVNVMSPSKIV